MGILHDELITDPLALGYAPLIEAGSHNALADLLNAPGFDSLGSVDITPMLEWIATYGVMAKLRTAVAGENEALSGIAEVALMLVSNPNIDAIDFSRPRVQQMLGALAQAGVIPTDAYQELIGMATIQVSRAHQLGLRSVSADQVSAALVEA